jgi:AraC-like DNA-binding protein
MMCLTIIHCRNLEVAIRRAAEFTAFCQSLSGIEAVHSNPVRRLDDNTAEFRFPGISDFLNSSADPLNTLAQCIAIWRRFCGWLIGKNIDLIEVSFQAQEPINPQPLSQIFNCKLSFNQPINSFRFPASYLQAPLVHTEESLKEFLRNAPYHLLASNDDDDSSLLSQMRRIIGNDLSREFLSVVEMASQLNMSVRTLRRRLKDVGTTYQEFKDNLRRDAAMAYLNRPELKINAVSALLGFDEPSAFHRSFKKWTGLTPGEYRNQQQSANQ